MRGLWPFSGENTRPFFLLQTLKGTTIPIEIESTDTVKTLKKMVEEREGISSQHQRLIYLGKRMWVLNYFPITTLLLILVLFVFCTEHSVIAIKLIH